MVNNKIDVFVVQVPVRVRRLRHLIDPFLGVVLRLGFYRFQLFVFSSNDYVDGVDPRLLLERLLMLLHGFLHLIYATLSLTRVHLVLPSWFLESSFVMHERCCVITVQIVLPPLVASDSSRVLHHSRLNLGVFFRHH